VKQSKYIVKEVFSSKSEKQKRAFVQSKIDQYIKRKVEES